MKASDFLYHRPQTVAETVRLLADYGGNARILAGGQSLMPMMNMRLWRPSALIDIALVSGLDGIEESGGMTTLGARLRYHRIENDPVINRRLPSLACMIRKVGDRQVRNRGTLGGSLVQADPTGEMPLAALALGASVTLANTSGSRTVAVEDFFVGSYATAIDPEEFLLSVTYPRHPDHFAFMEVNRRHNDFAVVSVLVAADRGPLGAFENLRIGLGGVDETPILARAAMVAAENSVLDDETIARAAEFAAAGINPASDIRASADYRRHLTFVYVSRALAALRDGV
jgi:carbon-monoxide dehydrogenase medium subunit